jgi:putative transposase
VHRSVKYLLQPTAGQRVCLDHLLWEQRKLYNRCIEERQRAWAEEGRSITRYEQFAGLNGMDKTDPDGLGRYGTCVARGTLTRLDLAYKAFYRRCKAGEKPGYPRFKGRWRFNSVSWPDAQGWKLNQDNGRLYLQGVGHVKLKLHRRLPGGPKTATLCRVGRRWWVTISCDHVQPKVLEPTGREVGIDLGVTSLFTTNDGEHTANPRFTRRAADSLAIAQRDLATKKRGSKRRRKAVERVAARHHKVANCRRDHAHQLSRRLVDGHDLIVHEDLRILNMVRSASGTVEKPGTNVAQKSGLNRSIHDAGWGQLLSFITYKAEEAGRTVIAVDPRNTSRTCSHCGHCEVGNRHKAVFRCLGCGHDAHADTNAAINILRAGQAQRLSREAEEVPPRSEEQVA